MKTYPSETKNGGTTIVLPSLKEAIDIGDQVIDDLIEKYKDIDPNTKLQTQRVKRDGKGRKGRLLVGTLLKKYYNTSEHYEECIEAITKGDPKINEAIAEMTHQLRDIVLDIEPQLSRGRQGFERKEEGITTTPELMASGDPNCCLAPKANADNVKEGAGDGAFRLIINTDTSWWGKPEDNAAMMGALVMIIQTIGPVEVWIQQGWRGEDKRDGITLFKLDYEGAVEPTQLAFWCGNKYKDSCFSYWISRGLGRVGTRTSNIAEIECNMMMRGDWLMAYGMNEMQFAHQTPTRRMELMARYIADTAMKIIYEDNPEDGFAG